MSDKKKQVEGDGLVWMEFEPRPGQRIALYPKYNKLGQLQAWARLNFHALEIAKGSSFDVFDQHLTGMAEAMAVLVADWDLVDAEGTPLSKPTSGAAFADLELGEDGETAWLIEALRKQLAPDPKS